MTVKELIEELKKCDPDLPVRVPLYPATSREITGVDGVEDGVIYELATGDTIEFQKDADDLGRGATSKCVLVCWGD